MSHRKKSLWLHFSVYLIIFILMFSVIGVVVIYLNGINEQQIYSVPVTTTPNDESAIQIVPQDNTITVTADGIETPPSDEANDAVLIEGEDTTEIEIDTGIEGEAGDEIIVDGEGEVAAEETDTNE